MHNNTRGPVGATGKVVQHASASLSTAVNKGNGRHQNHRQKQAKLPNCKKANFINSSHTAGK